MSYDSERRDGETLGRLNGTTPDGGRPRDEPFRNFGGWKCPCCRSTNTLIEVYTSGIEGHCMTCARTIPIPQELDAYKRRAQ